MTRPESIVPSFKCKDLGMDCSFEAKALTHGGLMGKIQEHAASVHNIAPIPPDLKSKIEANIH